MNLPRTAEAVAAGFPSGLLLRLFLLALGLVLFFYPFGFLFVTAGVLPEEFSWTGSIVITLYGVTVLLSEMRRVGPPAAGVLATGLACALYAAEYVGKTTGIPFGSYAYTDVLGFRAAGVPLAIPIAWYATVVSSWRIMQPLAGPRPHTVLVALGAGLLTVILDVALEPMASGVTRYWLWNGGTVPLQNYAAWFVLTSGAVLLLAKVDRRYGPVRRGLSETAWLVYGLQLLFFSVTNLAHGFVAAGILAPAAAGAVVAILRLRRRYAQREVLPR